MRLSYGLLNRLATLGDVEALNLITSWEKQGNPDSPTMTTEAHFQGRVDDSGTVVEGPGYFLSSPASAPSIPRRNTLPGIPAMRERTGTLLGMKAVTPADLGSLDTPFTAPDIIITDDDGDPDGDD